MRRGRCYSSLGYLNTLPIDVIKTDRSFIARLARRPGSDAIVTTIVRLANTLGMSVVAEGVETVIKRDELIRLGSDRGHGYYYARPMPAASVEALIRAQSDGTNPRCRRMMRLGDCDPRPGKDPGGEPLDIGGVEAHAAV